MNLIRFAVPFTQDVDRYKSFENGQKEPTAALNSRKGVVVGG